VDFSFTARPISSLLLNGDLEYTHGKFAEFNEVVAGANVSRTGNIPTNIPVLMWSLTPTQRFGPVSVSMSVRQVGERWADTANTRLLPAYTTLDSWVSVRLPRNTNFTLRGSNLTDEFYIVPPSTSFGRVGAPRTIEATIAAGF
jgi:iron complex outermembrane receptor protein